MEALARRPWQRQAPCGAAAPQAPCLVLACLRHSHSIGACHALGVLSNDSRITWNGGPGRTLRASRRRRGADPRVACAAALGGAGSEEERWQREEARWLREEQRWLREEARWNEDRRAWAQESQAMAEEVRVLKREVEELRAVAEGRRMSSGASLNTVVASLKHLLQSLPPVGANPNMFVQELSSVSENPRLMFDSSESDALSEMASLSRSSSIPSMSEFSIDLVAEAPERMRPAAAASSASPKRAKHALKKGAEGDEVKALQEALAALGFYSGEEEMEFAMFSTDTESAVKTWQASIGALEDGIVSAELLETLLGSKDLSPAATETSKPGPRAAVSPSSPSPAAGSKAKASSSQKRQQPRAAAAAASAASDPWKAPVGINGSKTLAQKQTFAEEKRQIEGTLEADIAPIRRVFLLGENRWEEPGRLIRPTNAKSSGPKPVVTEKCFSCRGEGVTMCTECEGTGELNVEDQFLDWLEEGSKCPYCEGSGAVPCDVCSGIGAVAKV